MSNLNQNLKVTNSLKVNEGPESKEKNNMKDTITKDGVGTATDVREIYSRDAFGMAPIV